MKYEYLCTRPDLPAGATNPMMDSRQMTDWMNGMAAKGWEFVGYGQKWWHGNDVPQDWWVFRRPDCFDPPQCGNAMRCLSPQSSQCTSQEPK